MSRGPHDPAAYGGAAMLEFLSRRLREGIVTADRHGTITGFSPAASEIFGYGSEEVVGQPLAILIPETERKPHEVLLRSLVRQPEPTKLDRELLVRALRKGGDEFSLRIRLGAWMNGEELVLGALLSDETSESDARANWEALAHSSSDLFLLLDREGNISFMSRDVPGLTTEEAPGSSIYDYLIWDGILPQNRDGLEEGLEQIFETGRPYTYESWGILDNGSKAWYWCRLTPQFRDGRVAQATLTISDVTERHERDAAMQRLALIIKSTQDAVISTNVEGGVKTWNQGAQRLFGYSEVEARGKPLVDLLPAETSEKQESFRTCLRALDRPQSWEGSHCGKNGTFIPVSISMAKLQFESGEFAGASILMRDTSAQRRLENALRAAKEAAENASRSKTEFLANMSHEIRTPMNGVMGMTELLLGTRLSDEQMDYVKTLQAASAALRVIIDDILDVSKLEAGQLKIENIDFDPRELVSEIAALFRSTAEEGAVSLEVEVDPGLPQRLVGDPHRLRQVLSNLVGNARKFTSKGGIWVRVRSSHCSARECSMRFEVVDTGVGIAPEAQRRIFAPFSQADGSITRKFGGTGLGLAICSQLVSLMGGTIGVESEPGKGSTFWFGLTLPVGDAASEEVSGESTRREVSVGSLRVLIAEDNRINQKVAKTMLKRLGCSVDIATNGVEALERFESGEYDMIFMDCQMPEMSGFEATREIRRRGGSLPIVAMTAQALQGDREACLAAGMDDYISKPISKPALAQALHRWAECGARGENAAS